MNVWSLIQLAYFIESGTFVGSLYAVLSFLTAFLKTIDWRLHTNWNASFTGQGRIFFYVFVQIRIYTTLSARLCSYVIFA